METLLTSRSIFVKSVKSSDLTLFFYKFPLSNAGQME